MASDYGYNFGFRRSDESVRVSEGQYRVPAGSSLKLGSVVEVDKATPGFLKKSAANAKHVPGVCGLLVQEEQWNTSIYGKERARLTSVDLGTAKAGQLGVITGGAGVKVWFKNTAQKDRADGSQYEAVTMADLTGVSVGDDLGWDGSKFVKVDGATITQAFVRVLKVDSTAGTVEGVLV